MRANRRTGTKPEVAVRSALHAAGHRFRKDFRLEATGVWVRPDVVFTRRRVAVFVDGCFWHVCPQHGRQPTTNEWYWTPKLRRNLDRDARVNAALAAAGWTVVRVWEHVSPSEAVEVIEQALAARGT
jgi:DNA mismatch endonuclease (patch repair protein)